MHKITTLLTLFCWLFAANMKAQNANAKPAPVPQKQDSILLKKDTKISALTLKTRYHWNEKTDLVALKDAPSTYYNPAGGCRVTGLYNFGNLTFSGSVYFLSDVSMQLGTANAIKLIISNLKSVRMLEDTYLIVPAAK
jgi:hypothetical protein